MTKWDDFPTYREWCLLHDRQVPELSMEEKMKLAVEFMDKYPNLFSEKDVINIFEFKDEK